MAALCYADTSVTERTDDLSEVLIKDSTPKVDETTDAR